MRSNRLYILVALSFVALSVTLTAAFKGNVASAKVFMPTPTVNWMTWTAPTGYPNTRSGSPTFTYANGASASLTLPDSTVVTATLTGEVVDQSCFSVTASGCPAGYWKNTGYAGYPTGTFTSTNVPNLPPNVNLVVQTGYVNTLHTLTFSQPVSNVVMTIVSLGGNDGKSSYTFNQDFTILSQDSRCNPAITSSPNKCLTKNGRVLEGWEGAGTIQFDGTYASLTWDVTAPEYYSGFNIGVSSAGPVATPSPSPSPSPTPAGDVTNTNDSGAGSLRAAVANATAGKTITIPASVTGSISLLTPIVIDKDLTINGPGARNLSIDAPFGARAFTIASGKTASISGVTIGGTGTVTGDGGVLSNAGTLSLTDVQVSDGFATGNGGGISSTGALTMTRTTVNGNVAGGNGGGIYCTGLLTLINSTVANNSATGKGGGVAAAGGLAHVVNNNTVSGNTAASGGGIYTGVLGSSGGAASVYWVNWNAPASYNLTNSTGRSFTYANGTTGTLTLPDSSVVNVTWAGEVISSSCFSSKGCTSFSWQGVQGSSAPYTSANVPTLPPTNDMIAETGYAIPNETFSFSAPVRNIVMNVFSLGGYAKSTYVFDKDFEILSQDPRCNPAATVQFCMSKDPANPKILRGYEGNGTIQFTGTFTSISWTHTPSEYYSGFNIGVSSAGPTIDPNAPKMSMSSNIVTANTATAKPDLDGGYTSAGNNWIGNSTGSTGFTNGTNKDVVGTALAGLGTLGNNGGQIDTMALAYTSPAVDRGSANSLTTDSRSGTYVRTYDFMPAANASDGTDIGSYEFIPKTVTNGDNSGTGSLRDTVQNSTAGDVIVIPKTAGPINLTAGPVVLDKDLTIIGPGARDLTINGSGNSSGSVVVVNPNVTANVSGATITGGKGTDNGSGVLQGGGFLNKGTLNLVDVQVKNNTADQGGGVYNAAGNTFSAIRTSLTGNSAKLGGGVYSAGNMTIINSTVAGNSATGATGTGGGIWLGGSAVGLVGNSTISANTATYTAAGFFRENPPALSLAPAAATVRSSIVAGNTIVAPASPELAPQAGGSLDVEGAFVSTGYNLIGAVNGGTGFTNGVSNDIVGAVGSLQDPGLDPLGNYGGGTDAMRLKLTSQARDKGAANALSVDQRGLVRSWFTATLSGGFDGTDIGAYEYSYTTAAGVGIGGTVRDARGQGVSGARVTVYDSETGDTFVVRTNQFGRYHADDLEVGRLYIVTVSSKRFPTATKALMLNDSLADCDFDLGNQ